MIVGMISTIISMPTLLVCRKEVEEKRREGQEEVGGGREEARGREEKIKLGCKRWSGVGRREIWDWSCSKKKSY
jgi:hypothetical protein